MEGLLETAKRIKDLLLQEAKEREKKEALTPADWVEIYYALYARQFQPPVCGDLKWVNHLRNIMGKIGPDGENMYE